MSDKRNYYVKRTVEHIHRVQKNMVLLVTRFPEKFLLSEKDIRRLMYSVMNHDRSKFSESQFYPYIELTEYYRQRKNLGNPHYEYPKGVKKQVDAAVQHHYDNENHHPEESGAAKKWDLDNALECACDLQAMAQEFGEGSARKYFNDVWKKKSSGFFFDDFNWLQIEAWILTAIECFESVIKPAPDGKDGV